MSNDNWNTLGRTHPIHAVDELLDPENLNLAKCLSTRKALIVLSPTIRDLFGMRLHAYIAAHELHKSVIFVDSPSGEDSKVMDQVMHVLECAQGFGLQRRDVIIAIGGGICCDLVGLAATLFRRGLPHIKIPTTLLGIVDAGIGIKNAVNAPFGKNKVGTFTPPEATFIDTSFLKTLPKLELLNGVAEIKKMGLVVDRAIFDILQTDGTYLVAQRFPSTSAAGSDLILRSIIAMQVELARDAFETGD